MIAAVIMAGGKGERFWPKSRTHLPKQFLQLSGHQSMIQNTVSRLEKLTDITNIYIVTNQSYCELIHHQLPLLPKENIIVEPVGRNTAPCIGLAAVHIAQTKPDSTMIVLPSDHMIRNEEEFIEMLKVGVEVAGRGENLVTLGITPSYPETGYGYIECTNQKETVLNQTIFQVQRFVEKPDFEKAKQYISSGKFLWNSGMFIWRTSIIMDMFRKHMPSLALSLSRIDAAYRLGDPSETIMEQFVDHIDGESIDYGVMENAESIYTIPCQFGWDDVGSWTSLDRIQESDDMGNVIRGHVISIETRNSIIEGNEKLIATLGVENLIIVDTEDVTLVCTKERAQEVKSILQELRKKKLEQYL